VIDQLREQIHKRLDELGGETERLRNALAALEDKTESAVRERRPSARRRTRAAARKPAAPAAAPTPKPTAPATSSRRKAPGSTKSAILATLAGGEAMTAGEVAAKAGLGRATVSTTLSKLASGGEVEKAQRGYRLPSGASKPTAKAA
jgi:biotin operon repressor